MAKTYTVVTPACSVYLADGAVALLYKGGALPAASALREGEAQRLLDGGFVTEDAVVEEKPVRVFGADSDPSDFTVAEVQAYLETASEDEKARVLTAEAAGKDRKALTGS